MQFEAENKCDEPGCSGSVGVMDEICSICRLTLRVTTTRFDLCVFFSLRPHLMKTGHPADDDGVGRGLHG